MCEKEFYSGAEGDPSGGGCGGSPVEKVKKSVVTPNYYPHTRPPSNPPKTKQRGGI